MNTPITASLIDALVSALLDSNKGLPHVYKVRILNTSPSTAVAECLQLCVEG